MKRVIAAVTSRLLRFHLDCCPHIDVSDDFPEETRNG